jgi:hypothetical protein
LKNKPIKYILLGYKALFSKLMVDLKKTFMETIVDVGSKGKQSAPPTHQTINKLNQRIEGGNK